MLILKKRIIKSIRYTDIATGESEFSINLLKQEAGKRNFKCHYDVLPNGYNIKSINEIVNKKGFAKKGDMVINLASMPVKESGMVNTLKISEIK